MASRVDLLVQKQQHSRNWDRNRVWLKLRTISLLGGCCFSSLNLIVSHNENVYHFELKLFISTFFIAVTNNPN